MKDAIAKCIRVVTVPAVTALAMLCILFFADTGVFENIAELVMSVIFLALIPLLAYPLAGLIPRLDKKGRKGQRTLAFVFGAGGYTLALLYGFLVRAQDRLLLIFLTYFLSMLLLTLFNRLLHFKASGHACGVVGPMALLCYFTGWIAVIPCVVIAAGVVWSSLCLKRHTVMQLLTGAACAAVAFGVGLLLLLLI